MCRYAAAKNITITYKTKQMLSRKCLLSFFLIEDREHNKPEDKNRTRERETQVRYYK